jgi:hypothetical protein
LLVFQLGDCNCEVRPSANAGRLLGNRDGVLLVELSLALEIQGYFGGHNQNIVWAPA